jgi:hypothetical protein
MAAHGNNGEDASREEASEHTRSDLGGREVWMHHGSASSHLDYEAVSGADAARENGASRRTVYQYLEPTTAAAAQAELGTVFANLAADDRRLPSVAGYR